MRGSQDVVEDCTSEVFEGVMFLTTHAAQDSWVAKWQRLQGYQPGLYAVKVNGIVSLHYSLSSGTEVGERRQIETMMCSHYDSFRRSTSRRRRTLESNTSRKCS
jgi:hypothetical protein